MYRVQILLLILCSIGGWSCSNSSSAENVSPPMQLVFWSGLTLSVVDWPGLRVVTPEKLLLNLDSHSLTSHGDLDIIVTVSAGENGVLGVMGWNGKAKSDYAFFVYLSDGHVEGIVPHEYLSYSLVITPGNRSIVFLSLSSLGSPLSGNIGGERGNRIMDIEVYDLATRQSIRLARGEARIDTKLSVTPDGQNVAFDAADGWIKSVQISSGEITKLLEGRSPSWSPDGSRIVYRKGSSLFIYEIKSKKSQRLFTRHFWQSDFVDPLRGGLYWSPDSRYIAVNLDSYSIFPINLKLKECLVVEVATGKASSIRSEKFSGDLCGPWLKKT